MAKRTDIEFSNKNPGAPGGPDDPDRNNDKILKALIGINENVSKLYSFLKTQNISGVNAQTRDYVKSQINANNANSNNINNTFDAAAKERIKSMKLDNKIKREKIKQNEEEKRQKLEIEKNKEKRAIELYKRQLEKDDLEKKILKEQAENGRKERNRNRYKEGTVYKTFSNIKGQPSNVASSIGLAVATGGLINPVIAKTLGLDKIVTASVKLAGRTVGNVTGRIYDATLGSMFKNMMNPFANKKEGAIAKNEEENNPIVKEQKKTNTILEHVQKDLTKEEKEEKKEGGGLLGKILQAIGGFGTILKGAAVAAIPFVIKEFFPKIAKWLDEKFKGFLNGTLGLSESTTEGVSQLVKDALPGALFGMTVGGWKGALIGAGLNIGINWIKDKWDEFQGEGDREGKLPAKIGPIPTSYVKAAIAGATIGGLTGFKGMMIGALVGIAGQGLWDLGNKLGEWAAIAVNWLKEHPATAIGGSLLGIANLGNIKKAASALSTYMHKAVDSSKNLGSALSNFAKKIGTSTLTFTKKLGTVTFGFLKTNISKLAAAMSTGAAKVTSGISKYIISHLPAIRTAMSGLVKAIGWLGAAFMAYDIGKMIGEWVGKKMNEKEEKEREKINKKAKSIKDMSKEELGAYNQWLHDTGQWEGYAQGYTTEKGLIWDSKKDFDYDRSLEQFHNYQEKILNNGPEYDVPNFKQLGFENLKQYSDVPWNSSIKRNRGIPKRIADNLNSIHDNVISPLQTALGTHKITITSSYRDSKYNGDVGGAKGSKHLTGNAVDLQVSGMTPEQVSNVLRKANIPFARAIREKSGNTQWLHLEYDPNGNNPGILANLNAATGKYVQVSPGKIGNANDIKLSTNDMPTTAENQYVAMNTMNETTQATAEAQEASNGGIMDLLGNISNSVTMTAENSFNGGNLFSGLGDISSGSSNNQGQSLSFSIPNTNGGANSSTGSVYQFGDVAKTPILYTL